MNHVYVVYLEEDLVTKKALHEGWTALFERVGLKATIDFVTNYDQAKALARASKCDVFICDLTLNKESDNSLGGLDILQWIKNEFPHITTVGTTGAKPLYTAIDYSSSSFDVFVPKNAIWNKAFDEPDYPSRLRRHLRILPSMEVLLPDSIESPLETKAAKAEELRLLVRQLFSFQPPADFGIQPSAVRLEQLSGGRSKSSVFSMHAVKQPGSRRFIPAIIKVSTLEDHREEHSRYNRLIKWSLPYTARVDLLAEAETTAWGAIAYSFAHGGDKFDTLTGILEAKDFDRAWATFDAIFRHTDTLWSEVENDIPQTRGLRDRYFTRYFQSNAAFFNANEESMMESVRATGLGLKTSKTRIEVEGTAYHDPVRALNSYDQKNFRKSLCHGDLNTNNVIVSENGNIALIDFRDAAIGHVFEDIITLEGCVRLFWGANRGPLASSPAGLFASLLEIERSIAGTGTVKGTSRSWELIRHIRELAFARFPGEPRSTYYFGLAYYCFRLMRLRPMEPLATLRLFACLLVAAEQFSE